ncbi:hypothetical protein BDZ89DRAFT_1225817 [Hymenopellis radicata]|nr:hypothetical protein BDZ89DRAFT_1225817 [Hymenopellis radicata]
MSLHTAFALAWAPERLFVLQLISLDNPHIWSTLVIEPSIDLFIQDTTQDVAEAESYRITLFAERSQQLLLSIYIRDQFGDSIPPPSTPPSSPRYRVFSDINITTRLLSGQGTLAHLETLVLHEALYQSLSAYRIGVDFYLKTACIVAPKLRHLTVPNVKHLSPDHISPHLLCNVRKLTVETFEACFVRDITQFAGLECLALRVGRDVGQRRFSQPTRSLVLPSLQIFFDEYHNLCNNTWRYFASIRFQDLESLTLEYTGDIARMPFSPSVHGFLADGSLANMSSLKALVIHLVPLRRSDIMNIVRALPRLALLDLRETSCHTLPVYQMISPGLINQLRDNQVLPMLETLKLIWFQDIDEVALMDMIESRGFEGITIGCGKPYQKLSENTNHRLMMMREAGMKLVEYEWR